MRRRPLPRAAAVGALALVGLTAASGTPCLACSCAAPSVLAEAAADADAVFVGTFTGTRGPAVLTSSSQLVAKSFAVREVRKGEAAARTEVLTASSGGSCGLEVEPGRTYVVVAHTTADGLRADLCGGTRLLEEAATGELAAVGSASVPASGEARAELGGTVATARRVLAEPVLWGPVAAASALVTGGLLLLARRRRTR